MSAPTSKRSFWTRRRKPAKRSPRPGQRERHAELRVELVDGPVGLDPRVRLRHAAHVAEVGLAVVAEARVDAREIDRHGALATVTSRPFRVGGKGKPVRIRRGPATVTGDARRIRATVPQRGTGRRDRVEPGSQETFLRPSPFRDPRGKGVGHEEDLHRCARGAPRTGARRARGRGERDRARRRRGADAGAAERRRDDRDPVVKDGTNACAGTSALGALDRAVAGDWAAYWGGAGFGYAVETIKGETHNDPFPADPAQYWSFWVNYRYQDQGLCGTELQEGDDVLMFVDCFSQTNACAAQIPLRISGVPATVAPGQTVTVRLEEFTTSYDPRHVHDDHHAGAGRGRHGQRRRPDRRRPAPTAPPSWRSPRPGRSRSRRPSPAACAPRR